MDYTVAIQLCHAPSFPTQLAHTEATYFQSHTCSHDTVYKETTLTCPNQQMTWHVARHWRKKHHKDFLLLIMGLVERAEWNSERGQHDKDRPANYTQVKYAFPGLLF